MPRHCELCGKEPSTGNTVSHANNKTSRRWMPNLQRVRALVDGRVRHLQVCTRCIRAGRVQKVPFDHSGAKRSRTPEPAAA